MDGGGGLHADEDILRGDKGVGLKRLYNLRRKEGDSKRVWFEKSG